ncbi:MAG: hypothetical protein PVF58_06545 [Candidatus Methanofastidiosia archaeon]
MHITHAGCGGMSSMVDIHFCVHRFTREIKEYMQGIINPKASP